MIERKITSLKGCVWVYSTLQTSPLSLHGRQGRVMTTSENATNVLELTGGSASGTTNGTFVVKRLQRAFSEYGAGAPSMAMETLCEDATMGTVTVELRPSGILRDIGSLLLHMKQQLAPCDVVMSEKLAGSPSVTVKMVTVVFPKRPKSQSSGRQQQILRDDGSASKQRRWFRCCCCCCSPARCTALCVVVLAAAAAAATAQLIRLQQLHVHQM